MIDSAVIVAATNVFPELGSTLPSCVLDTQNMLSWYNVEGGLKGTNTPFLNLKNERFTKFRLFNGIAKILQANPGIRKVSIAFSSHGTVIPIDGQNHSAVVTAESTWNDVQNTFIFDADLAALFNQFPNVRFFMTADICESADLAYRLVTRGVNKFLDPPTHIQEMIEHNIACGANQKAIAPILSNVAYVSGTGGKGFYSIDEGNGGAFTKHWTKLVRRPLPSAAAIAEMLDKSLDSQQQPQAHGGLKNEPWFS